MRSKKAKIIQFKGFRKSGKTTSIVSLINVLKEAGNFVISIKQIHAPNFSIDTKGKNTWKMAEAGSDIIIASSQNETSLIIKNRLDIKEIIKFTRKISNMTQKKAINYSFSKKAWILIEGFYEGKYPIIVTLEKIEDFRGILEYFLQYSQYRQIFQNIICLSGKFTSELNKGKNFNETEVRGKYIEIINDFALRNKEKFSKIGVKEIDHLRSLPFVDLTRISYFDFLKLI
ncbi:MAG: molybdopterin-guanine dinucleotide biosynthesis protein B [Promethearchaeota archaeon]